MSQAEFIRQALTKPSIRPVITVSPVNDELLSAVGKLTAEYGKINGNLNQIARCLNEYGTPYNALSQEVRAAAAELPEQYLTFEHDEFTMKPTLDKNGRLIPVSHPTTA